MDLSDSSSFIHQPRVSNLTVTYCGPGVEVLIMVISAPANFKARMGIRQSWGSKDSLWGKGGRLLFILGSSQNTSVDVSSSCKLYIIEYLGEKVVRVQIYVHHLDRNRYPEKLMNSVIL
jgi:hypothetical protein